MSRKNRGVALAVVALVWWSTAEVHGQRTSGPGVSTQGNRTLVADDAVAVGRVDQPALTVAPRAPTTMMAQPFMWGGGFMPGYYSPWGVRENAYGAALQGMASLTAATGQYYQDIQQARITREQSRQMHMDTQRKQLQLEMDYERYYRPTSAKLITQQREQDLDWARKGPPTSEIWSGAALNTLLQSILRSPAPTAGDPVMLSEAALNALHLTDGTTRANLALARDAGKINWPDALDTAAFDADRDRFSQNFATATTYAQSGKMPERAMIREMRDDLKRMESRLEDQVRDISPTDFILARRMLNQLRDNVQGLSNPQVVKGASRDWRRNVRSVSDLVAHCKANGLEFGPAVAPGDQAGYTAAYYSMRQYERSVQALTAQK